MTDATRARGGMGEALPANWLKDSGLRARAEIGALKLAREAIEQCLKLADQHAAERDAALERAKKAEAERDEAMLAEHEVGQQAANTQLWLDDASLNLKAALARVRDLEEGLRALRLTAQRWDDSFDGEIVAGIDALLAAPEPPTKEPKA